MVTPPRTAAKCLGAGVVLLSHERDAGELVEGPRLLDVGATEHEEVEGDHRPSLAHLASETLQRFVDSAQPEAPERGSSGEPRARASDRRSPPVLGSD